MLSSEGDDAAARLRKELLDASLPLPHRFRVLFSLRGLATPAAVDALLEGRCRALWRAAALTPPPAGLGDRSSLFRHEVAFALGQMQARSASRSLRALLSVPGGGSC